MGILHLVESNHKNVHFCSSCRIQSVKSLPFKELNRPKKKIKVNAKTIAKISDQKLFAVKQRNFAKIINKKEKVRTSSNSTTFVAG